MIPRRKGSFPVDIEQKQVANEMIGINPLLDKKTTVPSINRGKSNLARTSGTRRTVCHLLGKRDRSPEKVIFKIHNHQRRSVILIGIMSVSS